MTRTVTNVPQTFWACPLCGRQMMLPPLPREYRTGDKPQPEIGLAHAHIMKHRPGDVALALLNCQARMLALTRLCQRARKLQPYVGAPDDEPTFYVYQIEQLLTGEV